MIIIGLCLTAPIFLFTFTINKLKLIEKVEYKDKIASLYEEFNLNSLITALFNWFFIMRRLLLVATLIYC
jgi:hypothetical protein